MSTSKILIVDDDQDMRTALLIRMRSAGYEAVFAVDAISVMSVARKEKPDLILLDIGLPGGDGFLVMERLNQLPDMAGTPIIVVSARDPIGNRRRALQLGAHSFFQKPADNAELLAAIEDALGQNAPAHA